jgi:hypothetical protein
VGGELEEVKGNCLPESCNLIAIPEAKIDRLEKKDQSAG